MLYVAITNVLAVILVLGVMILIHELGHFLAAKYFGIRVHVFSFGFGPGPPRQWRIPGTMNSLIRSLAAFRSPRKVGVSIRMKCFHCVHGGGACPCFSPRQWCSGWSFMRVIMGPTALPI